MTRTSEQIAIWRNQEILYTYRALHQHIFLKWRIHCSENQAPKGSSETGESVLHGTHWPQKQCRLPEKPLMFDEGFGDCVLLAYRSGFTTLPTLIPFRPTAPWKSHSGAPECSTNVYSVTQQKILPIHMMRSDLGATVQHLHGVSWERSKSQGM